MATAAASRPSGPVLSIPSYRSSSPNRVKLPAAVGARSPGKSVRVSSPSAATRSRQSCMCSPTNHPGSFRCSRHRERKQEAPACNDHGHSKPASPTSAASLASGASKLGTKRTGSALVRLGGSVERGTWARRALAPSPQSPHRRRAAGGFCPRPSRLSAVSFAGERTGDNRQ
ncbi:uncharacterized protein [Lolium perenne]|uniref:uncharacterized protein n=1 Tax=Lolium perenne TaxID=4522 RepID=UPI0021EA7169|nr:uncharacterized protein LOC127305203 [Lolium perenne]